MNREQLSPVNDDNYNAESSSTIPRDLVEDEEYINRLLLVRDARSSSDEQIDDDCGGGFLPLHQMKSLKLSDDNSSSKSSENQKKMPPIPPSVDTQCYDHEKSTRWLGRVDDGMVPRRPQQWSDYAERYPSPPLDIDRQHHHHHHVRRDRGGAGGHAAGSRTDQETLPYYEERRWLERPSNSYRMSNNNDYPYPRWEDEQDDFRPQLRPHRQQQPPHHRSWDNSHFHAYDESSPYNRRGDSMYNSNDFEDSSPESGGNRHRPQDMSAYYPIEQARQMGISPRPNHKVGSSSSTRTKSKSSAAKISTDKWFDKSNPEDEKFRYVDDIPRTVVKKKSRSVSSPLQQQQEKPSRLSPHERDRMMTKQDRGEYFEPILHRGEAGDASSSYNDSTTSFPEVVAVNDDHRRNDKKKKPSRYESKQQQPQRPTWTTSPSTKKKPPPSPSPATPTTAATATTTTHTVIEIAPGLSSPLRGSGETLLAIKNGNTTETTCLCCSRNLRCIADAAYVICPDCRVVNQVPFGDWGVGLGF